MLHAGGTPVVVAGFFTSGCRFVYRCTLNASPMNSNPELYTTVVGFWIVRHSVPLDSCNPYTVTVRAHPTPTLNFQALV